MKTFVLCSSLVALVASGANGFAPANTNTNPRCSATRMASASTSEDDQSSRRGFLAKSLLTYTAAALATTGVLAPLPAHAAAGDKVNAKLKG